MSTGFLVVAPSLAVARHPLWLLYFQQPFLSLQRPTYYHPDGHPTVTYPPSSGRSCTTASPPSSGRRTAKQATFTVCVTALLAVAARYPAAELRPKESRDCDFRNCNGLLSSKQDWLHSVKEFILSKQNKVKTVHLFCWIFSHKLYM